MKQNYVYTSTIWTATPRFASILLYIEIIQSCEPLAVALVTWNTPLPPDICFKISVIYSKRT